MAALAPERPGTELVLDWPPDVMPLAPPKALLPEEEPPPKEELPPDEELPPKLEPLPPPNDEPPGPLLPKPELPPLPPNAPLELLLWAKAGAPASSNPTHARPRTVIRDFHRRMIAPLVYPFGRALLKEISTDL